MSILIAQESDTSIPIAAMTYSNRIDYRPSQQGPGLRQPLNGLSSSASALDTLLAPVSPPPDAPIGELNPFAASAALHARLGTTPNAYTCKVKLKIGFFFDGTGNNLDADVGTDEHSNVARLFRAFYDVDQDKGIYKHYIPGLGTYFREIGDEGGDWGNGFGARGEDRLDQAMKWLDETIAKHPADKIESIELSVFGFSRGSTLARAFARRVDARCDWRGNEAIWPTVNKSLCIHFLGLFDTVASVGLPASTGLGASQVAFDASVLDKKLDSRRTGWGSGLQAQAFGDSPGADPTPWIFDGHMAWAHDLRIPPVVSRTIHLMAMNELRNSFPLDTIWNGNELPAGATEIVYPGAHSNVGGGYRPGEAGKSLRREFMLSKIPLRKMYEEAVSNGVPLLPLDNPKIADDFAFDSELADRFNSVMTHAGFTQGRLGDALLAHSQLYYRWRFRKIRLRLREQEFAEIQKEESVFRREAEGDDGHSGLKQRVDQLKEQSDQAERDMQRKHNAWLTASQHAPDFDHEARHQAYMDAKMRHERALDAYLKEKGKLDTLPDYKGELIGKLDLYDEHLIKDVNYLKSQLASGKKLRPHYERLLQAYDDEFTHGRGLTDPLVIDFYDSFVHDSLAGFAKDVTLPSDPRCCYIGGDKELKYADNSRYVFKPTTST
ncbi:MAG: DUF2235 domain-containing protein [Burkholderiales bacterium]|nr:DUF2235 domain-containing protein [Burkholderiales bacterium]